MSISAALRYYENELSALRACLKDATKERDEYFQVCGQFNDEYFTREKACYQAYVDAEAHKIEKVEREIKRLKALLEAEKARYVAAENEKISRSIRLIFGGILNSFGT